MNSKVLSVAVQGHIIVAGYDDTTIRIWDLRTQTVLQTLAEHKSSINCVAIHRDIIVSGSDDGTIKIWKINKP